MLSTVVSWPSSCGAYRLPRRHVQPYIRPEGRMQVRSIVTHHYTTTSKKTAQGRRRQGNVKISQRFTKEPIREPLPGPTTNCEGSPPTLLGRKVRPADQARIASRLKSPPFRWMTWLFSDSLATRGQYHLSIHGQSTRPTPTTWPYSGSRHQTCQANRKTGIPNTKGPQAQSRRQHGGNIGFHLRPRPRCRHTGGLPTVKPLVQGTVFVTTTRKND